MADPIRPVFQDRIYDGDGLPRFNLADDRLPQITPIKQQGTMHDAGHMNNLWYFDNLISMSGTEYTTTGWKTKKLTETITEAELKEDETEKRLIAMRVWEETERNVWTCTEELFDINEFGQNVRVQHRIMTMSKVGKEWKSEVVF